MLFQNRMMLLWNNQFINNKRLHTRFSSTNDYLIATDVTLTHFKVDRFQQCFGQQDVSSNDFRSITQFEFEKKGKN
jgi:hypothetical protein